MKNLMKRGLAVMLAVAMCVSMLSLQAFAATAGATCPECGKGTLTEMDMGGGNKAYSCTYAKNGCDYFEYVPAGNTEPTPPAEHTHELDENGKCKIEGCDYKEEVKPVVKPCENHTWVNGVCSVCNAVCQHGQYDGNGACEICGMSKADMGPVEPPKQTEKPVEPAKPHNCANSLSNFCIPNNDGTHYRVCQFAGCGKTVEEKCTLTDGMCLMCGYNPNGGSGDDKPDDSGCVFGSAVSDGNASDYNTPHGTHHFMCKNQSSLHECPYKGNMFVKTEACEFEKIGENWVCKVCGQSVSPVTLGPGEGDKPCPDGEHDFVYKPTDPAHHQKVCTKCGAKDGGVEACDLQLWYENGLVVAHHCAICGNNIPTVPTETCKENPNGGHEFERVGEVLSPDGKFSYPELECKYCGVKKIDETGKCPSPVVLTINYVYADGSEAKPTYRELLTKESGYDYDVTSPEIEGYTCETPRVYGNSNGASVTHTVVYRSDNKAHTLTIHYHYGDGPMAGQSYRTDYTAALEEGKEYDVKSPTAPLGYSIEAGKDYVKGTMGAGNTEETVKYFLNTYTWTIEYRFADGETGTENATLPETTQVNFTVENIKDLRDVAVSNIGANNEFKPSMTTVPAPTVLKDDTVIVYYSRIPSKTVTVQYVLENGTVLKTEDRNDLVIYENGAPVQVAVGELPTGYELDDANTKTATYAEPVVRFLVKQTTPAPTDPNETENPSTSPNPSAEPSTSPNPSTPVTPNTPEDPEVPVPPENPEEPEVPVPPEVPVEDPEIPLVDVPEQDIPLSEEPPEEFRIEDPEIPLGDVPQTGDISLAWYATAFLSTLGLALMGLLDRRKNRES